MTTEQFFNELISKTDASFRKIPEDIFRNYSNRQTLTEREVKWIEKALKINKHLRGIKVPSEIAYELGYKVQDDISEDLEHIITEELSDAIYNILLRLKERL